MAYLYITGKTNSPAGGVGRMQEVLIHKRLQDAMERIRQQAERGGVWELWAVSWPTHIDAVQRRVAIGQMGKVCECWDYWRVLSKAEKEVMKKADERALDA